jgi:type IV secretory pathway VirB10-like protein
VSATPPPLPYSYVRRFDTPSRTNECRSIFRLDWSPILVAASASLALSVGVAVWIAAHPHKTPRPSEPALAAVVAVPNEPLAPPPPGAPILAVTPAVHRAPSPDAIVSHFTSIEEEPPPLPPPPSPPRPPQRLEQPPPLPVVEADPKQCAGETYGTQVLFLNDREAAADRARRERKLLFVMHISGNFEDSCFT